MVGVLLTSGIPTVQMNFTQFRSATVVSLSTDSSPTPESDAMIVERVRAALDYPDNIVLEIQRLQLRVLQLEQRLNIVRDACGCQNQSR